MTQGIVMLAWSDYVGITRCRAVPASQMPGRFATGLGWAVAGQALTPFADIAPNPWGPMAEVRQVPDPGAHVRLDIWADRSPFEMYLCDSRNPDGSTWDCCTRGFLRDALEDLRRIAGVELVAAFEHEFTLVADGMIVGAPFSVEAIRVAEAFTADLADALEAARVEPETIEPEYGYLQYEVTTAPAMGLAGADRAIITREVIRDVARHHGMRATFSPKPSLASVGNGAHVHFSLADGDGTNVTHDPARASGASVSAEQFIAGVVRHMRALTALVAPSPVSYYRLGPHHWSCGYASFGIQNREAAIRICPSTAATPEDRARGFNLELRPGDATASPYLLLGAMVRAGVEGIRDGLPLPAACDRDPADFTDAERAELGIVPLPASLPEALQALESDDRARAWMSPTMLESYLAVKRLEIELSERADPDEVCARYAAVY